MFLVFLSFPYHLSVHTVLSQSLKMPLQESKKAVGQLQINHLRWPP